MKVKNRMPKWKYSNDTVTDIFAGGTSKLVEVLANVCNDLAMNIMG